MTTTSPGALRRVLPLLVTGAYAAVVAAHLVAQVTGPGALRTWTQVVAMPLLALVLGVLVRAPRGRLVRWVLLGLGLSWLGDTVPKLAGEQSFLVMVAFFLLAQVAYVVAFWPARRRSVALRGSRAWPLPLSAYLLVLALLLVWCVPGAGALLVPVVAYGVVLVTMAVLSTGIHPLTALGGALFVLSDGLIALDAFADWYALSWHGLAVMSTYLAAQTLLVAGVIAVADRDRASSQ